MGLKFKADSWVFPATHGLVGYIPVQEAHEP